MDTSRMSTQSQEVPTHHSNHCNLDSDTNIYQWGGGGCAVLKYIVPFNPPNYSARH